MTQINTPNTAEYVILNLIKDHGAISQSKMFELSGYSRPMISIACEKLTSAGLIVADTSKTQNKKKNLEFRLNTELGHIIGISIGGTSYRIGIFNILGETIEIIKNPVDLLRGPEPILNEICEHIDHLKKKYCKQTKILGIGLAIPTPVKYEDGYANYPAFMPGWHMFDLKKFFWDKYSCPAFIDNEVNTMALEEYQQRKNKDSRILLCVKVGTGIGAGLVIENKIFRGENGGGGNIGHIPIRNATEICECGKTGCIEAVASAKAIKKKAFEIAKQREKTHLSEILKEKQYLDIQDIKDAADRGDRDALTIIKEAGEAIGEIIGTLVVFLDPAEVIITGQMTQLGPNYLYYIRQTTQKIVNPWVGHNFRMDFSILPTSSSAIGAARLCISELFEKKLILTKI